MLWGFRESAMAFRVMGTQIVVVEEGDQIGNSSEEAAGEALEF